MSFWGEKRKGFIGGEATFTRGGFKKRGLMERGERGIPFSEGRGTSAGQEKGGHLIGFKRAAKKKGEAAGPTT